MSTPLIAMLSPVQLTVLLIVGMLLFGRRLPEMGRSVGLALKEFKKGLAGIEDEISGVNLRAEPAAMVPALPAPRITESSQRFENDRNGSGPFA